MSSQPLWSPLNQTLFSDVFTVPPGMVCVLFAAGLERYKAQTTNTEFKSPQTVCVRRLLYDADIVFEKNAVCDWVARVSAAVKIADEPVQTCGGGCWSLTQENNMGVIGVPGTYRLELNDATAIGDVQVYADLYSIQSVAPQVAALFFT